MKSSSGKYYIGLDHIRAIAAFMVFTWHFIHINNGHHSPPPIYPLSLLTEGHTGVALFMTLSGYLFAKLLAGKNINFVSFIWNRILRLAPLLILVLTIFIFIKYLEGSDKIDRYLLAIVAGIVLPSMPNGGWSITAEFHFYILLPLLLFLTRKWKYSLIAVLIFILLIRLALYQEIGQIQKLSYWTIVGRVDQFILGIIAYQFRNHVKGKHFIAIAVISLFALFYQYFDSLGGFYKNISYPSPTSIWIYMPTIEGASYAFIIAWYDNSFNHSDGKISKFIALIGTYSYSIYLLHFFVVFRLAEFINEFIIDLSNIYIAIVFSILCFLLMIPVGYVSYKYIETPFLKFRTKYIIPTEKA